MYCTKCGKEIPDGEQELCEECQKKVQEEQSAEVKKEEKKEDKKANKKENKKTEKKDKTEKKEKKNKKDKESKDNKKVKEAGKKLNKVVIPICVAVLILAVILVVVAIILFSKNKIGNTIGNIRNYGYATIQGNWIYYLAPNEESTQEGIFKVKKDGSDKQELLMGTKDILSLNVSGNYIYYIGVDEEIYKEDDELDNKIYRLRTDGKHEPEVLNDNEFNNNCYEIYVINNSIYYIGEDANIYKMNLDGSHRTLVSDTGTGYLGITDKYILYNAATESEADYVTYIMNLDGTNARPLVDGKRLYSVSIKDDYVYYTNEDKQVYKTKIDSNKEEIVCDTTAYNLNLNGDYIYYLNYADAENGNYTVCIFRIKADGTSESPEKIKELSTYSSFIDVIGNWVIYMDTNDTSGYINLVKTDGSDEIQLYVLNYEDYVADTESETNTEEAPQENVDNGVQNTNETSNTAQQ